MTKREIAKLPEEEQAFIASYGLEEYDLDTIRSIERNHDYLVYIGWL